MHTNMMTRSYTMAHLPLTDGRKLSIWLSGKLHRKYKNMERVNLHWLPRGLVPVDHQLKGMIAPADGYSRLQHANSSS